MPLLHLWQEHFGFISDEAVLSIAEKLGLQPINILELVTFYPMFRQKSPGKTHERTRSKRRRGPDFPLWQVSPTRVARGNTPRNMRRDGRFHNGDRRATRDQSPGPHAAPRHIKAAMRLKITKHRKHQRMDVDNSGRR